MEAGMKLDLDALEQNMFACSLCAVDAYDAIAKLIARIRELESASQPSPSDKPVAFWNPAVDHDSAAFSYGQGGGYDVPLYTRPQSGQPGGGQAEVSTVDQVMADCEAFESAMVAAGYNRPDLGKYPGMYRYQRDQDRYTGWKLSRAAPSAGNGGAEGSK